MAPWWKSEIIYVLFPVHRRGKVVGKIEFNENDEGDFGDPLQGKQMTQRTDN